MKILIVNRFFGGAQIPTGRMAEDVARVLVAAGHEVTALASSGEYVGASRRADGIQHTVNGIRFEEVRVPKWMPRALAWLWFTWKARKRIPQMEWDVCVLMTDPPLLPLLARRAKRGSRLRVEETKRPKDGGAKARGQDTGNRGQSEGIEAREQYTGNRRQSDDSRLRSATAAQAGVTTKRRVAVWLMDLYPEALAASGRITNENPLYKWYFGKRQQSLAAGDLLICLGDQQKTLLGKALTEKVRTAVVPPWDDRGNIALTTEESLKNLALYAGNLGEAHCFEEILAAAPHLPADWTIRFAARGAKLAALKAAARGTSGKLDHGTTRQEPRVESRATGDRRRGAAVEITGYASEEETPKLLASARVHLITMSPGWEGIVVPSKLYGCIRTGRPVLFIGPENADTAREIRANNWGKVLLPGASGEEVAAGILELAARPTRAPQSENGAKKVAGELIRLAEGDG